MIEQAEKIQDAKPKRTRGPNKLKDASEVKEPTKITEDAELNASVNRCISNLSEMPGLLAYDLGFIVGRTISLFKENQALKKELEAFR